MSNVVAGIGRGQMTVLDSFVAKRRNNFEQYKENFASIKDIEFLNEPNGSLSNRWLSCILMPNFDTREGLRLLLEKDNIETRPLWKPMHQQPIFKDTPRYLNGVSDDLFERGLCLPSGSNLPENELNRVVSIIKSYF